MRTSNIKVNESQFKQCEVIPHFFTGQNILKQYSEKINICKNYWFRKVNIDRINWEKLFVRSTDHK